MESNAFNDVKYSTSANSTVRSCFLYAIAGNKAPNIFI